MVQEEHAVKGAAGKDTGDLVSGSRVEHPTRGKGTVMEVAKHDARGKPYKVVYDRSGEVHHYSEDSAQKLSLWGRLCQHYLCQRYLRQRYLGRHSLGQHCSHQCYLFRPRNSGCGAGYANTTPANTT